MAGLSTLAKHIVGHSTNLQQLEDMLQSGRLPPVMLFLGPDGIGKKLVALALGQRLVCDKGTGCGSCGPCIRVAKNESESVRLISPEGAQIKVDQTRAILDELSLQTSGKARVWILDHAEKLNPQAANSLLKSFEEPPPHCFFILVTSSQSQVLPTIRSRSQIVRFSSLSKQELQRLRQASDWAYISSQGQIGRLDQLIQPAYDELRKKSYKLLTGSVRESQTWASLQLKELLTDRETGLQVLGFWQQFIRDWHCQSQNLEPLIHQDLMSQDLMSQDLLTNSFQNLPEETFQEFYQNLIQAERDLTGNIDRMLVFEQLCREFKEISA